MQQKDLYFVIPTYRLREVVKNLFRPSYGGNRNYTLVYTLGSLMVSADDDATLADRRNTDVTSRSHRQAVETDHARNSGDQAGPLCLQLAIDAASARSR
jgi:hypothetical protein